MCAAVTTLKASRDYQRIARQGQKWHGSAFIMQTLKKDDDASFRLGLTASRRVGNAVVRNRAKRRLREMVRLHIQKYDLSGWDIVLIARTAAAAHDFAALGADFEKGLKILKVTA